MKTFLEKHWGVRKDPDHFTISNEEKSIIRATIIDALGRLFFQ